MKQQPIAAPAADTHSDQGVTLHRAIRLALVGTLALGAGSALPAEKADYRIPPGPLGEALNRFAAGAGVALVVDAAWVEGITTGGLDGRYGVDEGFSRLLEGSGYRLVPTAEGYVLQPVPVLASATGPADAQPTLQTVEVIGRSEQQTFADFSFSVTKTETHVLDIPQSVSAVTKEVIQDQQLMRLNDIAPFVAGVNEFSVYDDLVIRGFRSSDDRRVNGLRTFNSFWSQPSIAHLERVEVIKGPAAATFGAASPGGVINMVTKKPLPEPLREVQASYGSFDRKYLAADLTGPLNEAKTVLYRLNLAGEDADSFRDVMFNETYTIAPSFTFLPWEGTGINLDFVYTDARSLLDRGQPNVDGIETLGLVPIEVNVSQPGDKLDTQVLSAALSLDQRLTERWSLGFSYMTYLYDEQLEEHRGFRYITDSVLRLDYTDRDSDATVHSSSLYLTGSFDTGPATHRLVTGVDYSHREDDGREVSADGVGTFDVLNPENFRRDVGSYELAAPSWSPWGGTLETLGVYLHDQIIWGQWELLAGLRYDSFSSTTHEGGVKGEKQDDSQLSPRLGLVYKLDEDKSLYGSWINGFEPADYWVNLPKYGGPFDPSESEQLEVGYKQLAFDGRLLLTAALYHLTKTNTIVSANDPDNPDLYIQRGEERSRGFELEANGRITDRLSLIANYAYTDAEITDDPDPALVGLPKENVPSHAATLWGRYDLGRGWGVGAGVTYVGERHTFEETLQLPAYTLLNAGVYYTRDNLELTLLGRNLTDEDHWTGGYNYSRVFPGDPLTVDLSLKYRF
jgi:iron complex outermembrane recepter protein